MPRRPPAFRQAADSSLLPAVPEADEDDSEAPEGRLLTRVHRVRERDRRLVERKKTAPLARHGSLACEVCKITLHHRKPSDLLGSCTV